jgi:hypothetical protein
VGEEQSLGNVVARKLELAEAVVAKLDVLSQTFEFREILLLVACHSPNGFFTMMFSVIS